MTRARFIMFFLFIAFTGRLNAAEFPCAMNASAGKTERGAYALSGLAAPKTFAIADRGAMSYTTNGSDALTTVGYARVQASGGSTTPAGFLMFRFRQGGVLVTEATVPAAQAVLSGRIYAEVAGAVNTGLAIANPNPTPATVNFYFTNLAGENFGSGSFTLPPNGQIARFLNESPYGVGSVQGTLTFSASIPVGVIALRGFTNERGEFLITTLPVAGLGTAGSEDVFLPHYAEGGGWSTQVVLVNPTDTQISGSVQFLGQGGSTAAYSIAARSSQKIVTSGAGASIRVGAVRVTPTGGSVSPSGLSIFTYRNGGVTVSEAGVPVLRSGAAFRLYDEECGEYPGQIQTGIAIANPSTTASATVALELTDMNGLPTGMTSSITLGPSEQRAAFMKELPGFGGIPYPFHGVVRITTTAPSGVAVVGLRGRYNERGDFLVTTAMPSNETIPPSNGEGIFPHLADGGGYTTEFILFSGSAGQSASGNVAFYNQAGASMN